MNASALQLALGLACTCAAGLPQPAVAYTPVGNLSVGPGAITLFVYGNNFLCNMQLSVDVAGGVANVTGVQFSAGASPLCNFITANNLPWRLSSPSLVPPPAVNTYRFTIAGFNITARQASGTVVAQCAGSVNATIDQTPAVHRVQLSGLLMTVAPVAGQYCQLTSAGPPYMPTTLTAP